MVSGTQAVSGAGKLLVIAVGTSSVSGKIRAQVYGDDDEEEGSPLFQKLDKLVVVIGKAGTTAALVCFFAMCIIGLGLHGAPWIAVLEYVITTITIVCVAVPEGLPLAVTLALAFSSTKMMDDANLVKHLDACETMGSATTICSDKTGTLTANRMTVRSAWVMGTRVAADSSSTPPVGVKLAAAISKEARLLLATSIAVSGVEVETPSRVLPKPAMLAAIPAALTPAALTPAPVRWIRWTSPTSSTAWRRTSSTSRATPPSARCS